MSRRPLLACLSLAVLVLLAGCASHELCEGFGPQTPRDISDKRGENTVDFPTAPPASEMSLCNLHFHKNAEHKGPEFSTFAGPGEFGGYQCNDSAGMAAESGAQDVCNGVKAGDTIEFHWVHSTCDVEPGPGLGSCAPATCESPLLRVEAQVFLVVEEGGVDFAELTEAAPGGSEPVTFRGSTTGPKFDAKTCSEFQVTWSVRPDCKQINLASLGTWCERGNNPYNEYEAHGVRPLVTALPLLSEIE